MGPLPMWNSGGMTAAAQLETFPFLLLAVACRHLWDLVGGPLGSPGTRLGLKPLCLCAESLPLSFPPVPEEAAHLSDLDVAGGSRTLQLTQ